MKTDICRTNCFVIGFYSDPSPTYGILTCNQMLEYVGCWSDFPVWRTCMHMGIAHTQHLASLSIIASLFITLQLSRFHKHYLIMHIFARILESSCLHPYRQGELILPVFKSPSYKYLAKRTLHIRGGRFHRDRQGTKTKSRR